VKNEQVALLDARSVEGRERTSNECATKASASVRSCDGKVMNEATTAVVAAENGRNDQLAIGGDKAEPGVAFEKSAHALERVGIAETDTFSRVPQLPSSSLVFGFEYANVELHAGRPNYRR
jgi:hypothetical protein